MEILLASQMSSSGQHEPWPPTPAFLSLSEGSQPSTLPFSLVSLGKITTRKDRTYLAVDKLEIPRALGVTVSSTVFSACLIAIILGHSPICIHGGEVQGTVQTTRDLRNIHIEAELGVGQIEHLISAVIFQQIQPGADIRVLDKSQCQGTTVRRNAIGPFVVRSIDSTVLGASLVVGAEVFVPLNQSN